jgi:hypothetical protein
LAKLKAGEIVALGIADWSRLSDACEVKQRHATGMAGDLLIVKIEGQLAAIEEVDTKTRAVRPLPNLKTANQFVKKRMEIYDRMWDG